MFGYSRLSISPIHPYVPDAEAQYLISQNLNTGFHHWAYQQSIFMIDISVEAGAINLLTKIYEEIDTSIRE